MRQAVAIALVAGLCLLIGLTVFLGTEKPNTSGTKGVMIEVDKGVVSLENGEESLELKAGDIGHVTSNKQLVKIRETDNGKLAGEIESGTKIFPLASDQTIASATIQDYWITGYVKSEDGKPILQSQVSLVYYVDMSKEEFQQIKESIKSDTSTLEKYITSKFSDRYQKIEKSQSATSNSDGYYTLSISKPGLYSLQSIPPDSYLVAHSAVWVNEASSSIDCDFTHIDAPYVFQGKVINKQTKESVQGAEVKLSKNYYHTNAYHANQREEQDITDAEGRFAVRRLAKGMFWLDVRAEGYVDYKPHRFHVSEDPLAEIDIDVHFDSSKEHVIEIEPGYAVKIMVFDSSTQPVSQADVSIMSNKRGFSRINKKTNDHGICLINNIPKGEAIASAKKEPYGETLSEVFEPGDQDDPPAVEIILDEAASISGRVSYENGEPVTKRYVNSQNITPNDTLGGSAQSTYSSTQTDEYGNYTLNHLGEGKYKLSVQVADEGGGFGNEAEKIVSLSAGEDKSGIDFVLKEIETNEEVKGKVVNENDEPMEGIRVFVSVSFAKDQTSEVGKMGSDNTDENGEFFIKNLAKGNSIYVIVDANGYEKYSERKNMDGKYLTIQMKPTGEIKGIVIAKDSQQPIAGSEVVFEDIYGTVRRTTTDEQGRFGYDNLDHGVYEISAKAENFARSDLRKIEVKSGKAGEDIVFELEAGHEIAGTILGPKGNPISGAQLGLLSKMKNPNSRRLGVLEPVIYEGAVQSDTQGHFTIINIASAGDMLMISHPDYAPQQFSIKPEMFGRNDITIQMTHGGGIEGKVVGNDGIPLNGETILAINYPENLYCYQTKTNEQGEYRIENMPNTVFTVMCGDGDPGNSGRNSNVKRAFITTGKMARVDFGTGEGAVIYGTVYKDGAPLPNAKIVMNPSGVGSEVFNLKMYSDANGQYRFEGVPEGRFTLVFSSKDESFLYFGNADGIGSVTITPENDEYQVDLYAQVYEMKGTVTDAETSEPLSDVEIKSVISNERGPDLKVFMSQAVTNNSGNYTMHLRETGPYDFAANKEGYKSHYFHLDVELNQESPSIKDFVMEKGDITLEANLFSENGPFVKENLSFMVSRNGLIQPMAHEPVEGRPGVYLLHGFSEGVLDLGVQAMDAGRLFIAVHNNLRLKSGERGAAFLNMREVGLYIFQLLPSDGSMLNGPYQLTIPQMPELPEFPMPKRINLNNIETVLPPDLPVQIKIPGYKTAEFIPEQLSSTSPGSNAFLIKLPLEKE